MSKVKVMLLLVAMVSILSACAAKREGSMLAADIEAAKAECFEQAQDMTNATVDPLNPTSNDYFKVCMRTRFGYTDAQMAHIWPSK